MKSKNTNPIADIVDDKAYKKLDTLGLINKGAIRDMKIREMYKELKKEFNMGDAIEKIQEEYPYLQFDTIRKIVYSIRYEGKAV